MTLWTALLLHHHHHHIHHQMERSLGWSASTQVTISLIMLNILRKGEITVSYSGFPNLPSVVSILLTELKASLFHGGQRGRFKIQTHKIPWVAITWATMGSWNPYCIHYCMQIHYPCWRGIPSVSLWVLYYRFRNRQPEFSQYYIF